MNFSLIADTGIQFCKLKLEINSNKNLIKNLSFWEDADEEEERITLDYATYLDNHEVWASRRELVEEEFINENGSISEDIILDLLTPLEEEDDIFTINDIMTPLDLFENKWLPLPYFEASGGEANIFGPVNWCRLKLIPISKTKSKRIYQVVLVFDSTSDSNNLNEGPVIHGTSDSTTYKLCGDQNLLLNFCDVQYECGWVQEYLAEIVHGGEENIPDEFPSMKYLAYYIYAIKYFDALDQFPIVKYYANIPEQSVDVDLVLDIGNSRTCGLLFESVRGKENFEFTEVKELALQDLSAPENELYDDPFSMRLAFHKVDFGDIGYQSSKFVWPSFVRVGREAKRVVYGATNLDPDGKEEVTNYSSPKRYLWDDDESDLQWELVNQKDNYVDNSIDIQGITEQFNSDGSFSTNGLPGIKSNFSRKSLMTFVFIEILSHALIQINSDKFRRGHEDRFRARRLKRLIVTCPTAMVREEQIRLRQCAKEAAIVLNRFHNKTYNNEFSEGDLQNVIEVIPSVKDLKKDLTQLEKKGDWNYDEATCAQLVFLYAEIAQRYRNKCDKFFNLYGKKRNDLNEKSLTIGSLDIGGGTTDLMINTYTYEKLGKVVLTPAPLYWESFNLAGDSLLKEIIKEVILEKNTNSEEFQGCSGVIESHGREKGITDIEERLNGFFGSNKANQLDFQARQIRRKFNIQILIPIAEKYLSHTADNEEDKILSFDEMFSTHQPNSRLLEYFEQKMGFDFRDIAWKLSKSKINTVIENIFEPLIRQVCTLLHVYSCDFVLLAGRPTSLTKIEDLFLKYYPVSPDRIIGLNNYRVGRWYPLSDNNNYFKKGDQKSIVAVGACIALMGGNLDRLKGFKLNMNVVKEKLISTAEYFGYYDVITRELDEIFLSPDNQKSELKIDGMPNMIGFKRLNAKSYPVRVLYKIDFNRIRVRTQIENRNSNLTDDQLNNEVNEYIFKLKSRTPFKIKISRDYNTDREKIIIESVTDVNNVEVSKGLFKLKLQTLDESRGYWLDTGEFKLKIRAR